MLEFKFFCEFYEKVSLRECEFPRLVEGAVQIFAEKAGPVITSHHTIRVQHRDNIKDIRLSQLLSRSIVSA